MARATRLPAALVARIDELLKHQEPRDLDAFLREGNVIAADSDSGELHFLWPGAPREDGSAAVRVCRADFESFEVLASSVEAFLSGQLDAALKTT